MMYDLLKSSIYHEILKRILMTYDSIIINMIGLYYLFNMFINKKNTNEGFDTKSN